jgi:protein involved in polysaccharide export with SLBB domain
MAFFVVWGLWWGGFLCTLPSFTSAQVIAPGGPSSGHTADRPGGGSLASDPPNFGPVRQSSPLSPAGSQEIEGRLKALEQADPARAAEIRKSLGQGERQPAREGVPKETKGSAESQSPKDIKKRGEEQEKKGDKPKEAKEKAEAKRQEGAKKSGEQQERKDDKSADEQGLAATRVEKPKSAIESLFAQGSLAEESFSVDQFGYDLFQREQAAFMPASGSLVGPDYVLGPNDQFLVTVWGLVEGTYEVRVCREGMVTFPRIGVVPVAGVSYGDLKNHIERAFSKYYKNFQLSVTMGQLRGIQVYIVGEVQKPGSYSLDSLSTMFNALFISGGPKKSGTLRDIRLLRSGKVIKHLDLYDFLLKGDKSQDIRLQDQDTIFVPLIGPVVGVGGHVYRPGIYELKGPAVLGDLIELAGGVRPTGYLTRVQVERIRAHEKKIVLDFDLSALPVGGEQGRPTAAKTQVPMQNMDYVRVFPISTVTQEAVALRGQVARPGLYQLKEGMRIKDVIRSLQDLLPDASLDYARVVRRNHQDLAPVVIPFSIGRAIAGATQDNLLLQNADEVIVFSQADFKDSPQVSVEGEVRKPGTFPLLKETRVSDLLYEAGSLTKDAYLRTAELVRVKPNREFERVYVDLSKAIQGDRGENLVLRDEDRLVVHSLWEPQFKKSVTVSGSVNKPGEFPLVEGMRISDLIFAAGGLKKNAYLNEAEIMRYQVVDKAKMQAHPIKMDLDGVLAGNPSDNLELQDYDHLIVKVVTFDIDRSVTVSGEVRFPGSYRIAKGETLSSVLKRAGGFTTRAFPKGAIFIRELVKRAEEEQIQKLSALHSQRISSESSALAMGGLEKPQADAQKELLASQRDFPQRLASQVTLGRMVVRVDLPEKLEGTPDDLILENGDSLEVPPIPDTVTVLGSVRNPTSLLYRNGTEANEYVRLAGGLTPDADWEGAYLVKADGSAVALYAPSYLSNHVQATAQVRNGARYDDAMLVERGDTIVVPLKVEVKTRPAPIWQSVPEPR